jgi:hypothetical protein
MLGQNLMIHFNLRSTGRVETSPGSEYGCICEPHLRVHLHPRIFTEGEPLQFGDSKTLAP